jgi:hypothetical protein
MNGLVVLCLALGVIAIVLVLVLANMGQDYSPTSASQLLPVASS